MSFKMMRSQSVYPVDENANSSNSSKYDEEQQQPQRRTKSTPAVLAPPIKYDLRTSYAATAYNHISELTAHIPIGENAYVHEYLKKVLFENHMGKNNNQPIVFGYIPAPPNQSVMKQVIGLDGHFFKMTTTLCGVYFIWHDVAQNMFLFWGPSTFKVVKALNSIRWRIFKCYEMYNTKMKTTIAAATSTTNRLRGNNCLYAVEEVSDDEDYDNMPELISQGSMPDNETNDYDFCYACSMK